METYQIKANKWKESTNLPQYLKDELLKMNEDELYEAFYRDLEFGTGGLRGIMGVGTNRMNEVIIKKATLGFARYLLENEENAKEKGVVLAHDNRMFGNKFCKAAADVLTSLGIKAYVFDSLRTTPELSFAVRYLNCCGGINVTASHNPKEYNGYKIYNADGNQLILEQSNKVLEKINEIEDELSLDIKANDNLLEVLDNRVDDAFLKMVEETAIHNDIDKSNIKVVYTPQHGTGYIPVTTILRKQGFDVVEVKEQCFPSNTFENTKCPNPEVASAYDLAIEYARTNNADLICTTDPDCDRVGIVLFDNNKEPIYMTGNQTGALLIEYLLSSKKENNTLPSNAIIYNTIVTSYLGNIIAASYGVKTKQTLTGFKYIGNEIKVNKNLKFVMGYEESYGYLFNENVRDKDGVQSIMLICEMASYYKHKGLTLLEQFNNVCNKYGFFEESQYSYMAPGATGAIKIKELMESFRNESFNEILGNRVVIKEDYLSLTKIEDGKVSTLDYERSNVLRYVFEDKSFVAIRPSGTEPKCKFYFSISGTTAKEAKDRHDAIKKFILDKIK